MDVRYGELPLDLLRALLTFEELKRLFLDLEAFLLELALEGLAQTLTIAREDLDSTVTSSEMARLNLMRSRG